LSPARPVLSRCPLAREASGESEYGDLSREHGRHLRRHRIRRRHAGIAENSRFFPERISEGVRENSFWHKRESGRVLEKSRRARKKRCSCWPWPEAGEPVGQRTLDS